MQCECIKFWALRAKMKASAFGPRAVCCAPLNYSNTFAIAHKGGTTIFFCFSLKILSGGLIIPFLRCSNKNIFGIIFDNASTFSPLNSGGNPIVEVCLLS